jgi:hypothetical protein
LKRLVPKRVFVTGSSAAVSEYVMSQLRALPNRPVVARLGGGDRYATAAKIADQVKARRGSVTKVVVANGSYYGGALAIGPLAAAKGWPILLTKPTILPPATASCLTRMNAPSTLVVLCSDQEVSDGVVAQLKNPATMGGGPTLPFVSASVYDYAKWLGEPCGHVGLAKWQVFADGLTAAPYLARDGGLLLLTDPNSLTCGPVLSENKWSIGKVDVFGSPVSVSNAVVESAKAALR